MIRGARKSGTRRAPSVASSSKKLAVICEASVSIVIGLGLIAAYFIRTFLPIAEWDVLPIGKVRDCISIDLPSPKGGKAPIDPSSRDLDDEVNARFMSDANMAAQIDNTHALKDVQLGDYAAIYFPGGHGTMWDFPESDDIQSAIRTMYEDGKVVAAVCHGPAAFVNVKLSDGSWFVNGKTLSTFTDEEERAVEKDSLMPFLLEEKLKSRSKWG